MLYITPQAHARLTLYAKHAWEKHKSEIGGIGLAHVEERRRIIVTDVWPVKLESANGGQADLDKEALAGEQLRLSKEPPSLGGGETLFTSLRVWWHTHAPSGLLTFSSEDVRTMSALRSIHGDWMVGLLTNGTWVKGEVHQYAPIWMLWALTDVPLYYVLPPEEIAVAGAAVDAAMPEKKAWSGQHSNMGFRYSEHDGELSGATRNICAHGACIRAGLVALDDERTVCPDCYKKFYKGHKKKAGADA